MNEESVLERKEYPDFLAYEISTITCSSAVESDIFTV
jgi:hypothetical protein